MNRPLATIALLGLVLAAPPAPAAATSDPRAATASLTVRLDPVADTDAWSTAEPTRRSTVRTVTGSGFLVSASGYLLTGSSALAVDDPGFEVGEVEVRVIPDPELGEIATYPARVVVVDPDLGLALLQVDADRDLPYLGLGDSGVLGEGQRLSVAEWRSVEDLADEAADDGGGEGDDGADTADRALIVTRAVVVRTEPDPDGPDDRRLRLQGKLETGADGGAAVDVEGYVLAVARTGGEEDPGTVGVPVNAVKEFLAVHGPAGELPRSLALGPLEPLGEDGLRLRVVDGLDDDWPGRTRFHSPRDPDGVRLRIDRFASRLGIGGLEARLLAGGFGAPRSLRAADASDDARDVPRSRTRLYGSSRAERGGVRLALEYVVGRVGDERFVARYELPADLAAYNRSVLRASLQSLHVTRFLMLPVDRPLRIELEPAKLDPGHGPEIRMPEGWRLEAVVPFDLAELPPPDVLLSASPEQDYTVSFTAYRWGSRSAAAALAVGQGMPQESGTVDHGVSYRLRRAFVPDGGAIVLLECRAPESKDEFVRNACLTWQAGVAEVLLGGQAEALEDPADRRQGVDRSQDPHPAPTLGALQRHRSGFETHGTESTAKKGTFRSCFPFVRTRIDRFATAIGALKEPEGKAGCSLSRASL